MSKKNGNVRAKVIKGQSTVRKSDTTQNIKASENSYSEWLTPDVSLTGLEQMVQHSSILPQCINAYKSNIAGFGIGVRYKEDVTDTEKLEKEFKRLQEIIDCLTFECDTKEVFENLGCHPRLCTMFVDGQQNGCQRFEHHENVVTDGAYIAQVCNDLRGEYDTVHATEGVVGSEKITTVFWDVFHTHDVPTHTHKFECVVNKLVGFHLAVVAHDVVNFILVHDFFQIPDKKSW